MFIYLYQQKESRGKLHNTVLMLVDWGGVEDGGKGVVKALEGRKGKLLTCAFFIR